MWCVGRDGATRVGLLSAAMILGACRNSTPTPRRTVRAWDSGVVHADTFVRDVGPPRAAAHFEPHWACRLTGHGHGGRLPPVSVPQRRPNMDSRVTIDTITLRDGRTVRRDVPEENGRTRFDQARLTLRDAGGAQLGQRVVAVRAGMVEMVFEDARGVGSAWYDGERVIAERIGSEGEEVIIEHAGDPTRACPGPTTDALRLVPLSAEPRDFPRVTGMPPSVADARWTLARAADGLCVVRLEGEGPWGRVLVEAAPAGLVGELLLDESVNPALCAPIVDAGVRPERD